MSLTDAQKKKALALLDRRDLSVKQFTDKLTEKGETPDTAAQAAEWLIQLHVLDDGRYAGLVVRHYSAKGFGKRRVRDELYRRGVPRELWDEALASMPETDDALDRLLRSKLKSPDPDRDELKKAAAALSRRGYSWDEISAAVERFKLETEE